MQAVDFHTLGQDFFPAGSAQRLWLDAYAKGVDRFSKSIPCNPLRTPLQPSNSYANASS
jgi:hypothetical protein